VELNKLPNAFTRKLIYQNVGFGKPISIQTKNEGYHEMLTHIFNDAMMRHIQSNGEEALSKLMGHGLVEPLCHYVK